MAIDITGLFGPSGGAGAFPLVNADDIQFDAGAEVTLDTNGDFTQPASFHFPLDTFADAASDNVRNITRDANAPAMIVFRPANDARTIVVGHDAAGGNISCVGQADITLDDIEDWCLLLYDSVAARWYAMSAGGGGGGGPVAHADTTGQTVDDHHNEDHNHDGTPTQQLLAANTHDTPGADTHHAEAHVPESHTGQGATAAELETLTDGSDADALHGHSASLPPLAVEQGTYTGDGGVKTIPVGFAAKMVMVKAAKAGTSYNACIRTTTMTGSRPVAANAVTAGGISAIDSSSFDVTHNAADTALTNESGTTYLWFAIGGDNVEAGSYTGTGLTHDESTALSALALAFVTREPEAGAWPVQWRGANFPATLSFDLGGGAYTPIGIRNFSGGDIELGTNANVNAAGETYHYVAVKPSGNLWEGYYIGTGVTGHFVPDAADTPAGPMSFDPFLVLTKLSGFEPAWKSASMAGSGSMGLVEETFVTDDYVSLTSLSGSVELGADNDAGSSSRSNQSALLHHFFALSVAGDAAPEDADYLVGTAHGDLSAEIVVGTTPGGELGGTWPSPIVDATHAGSAHHAAAHTLASHSTKPHSALSDAPTDAHHPQVHAPESHTGQGATATELETLTDGSDADALHNHPLDMTPAEHTAIGDAAPHHAKYTDAEALAAGTDDATSDPLVTAAAAADGTEGSFARKDHVHPYHASHGVTHNAAHGISKHTEHATWKVLYTDGAGDEQELALGAADTVLRSAGVGAAPTMSVMKVSKSVIFSSPNADLAVEDWLPDQAVRVPAASKHGTWTPGTVYVRVGTVGTGTNTILFRTSSTLTGARTTRATVNLGTAQEASAAITWTPADGEYMWIECSAVGGTAPKNGVVQVDILEKIFA